MGVIGLTKEGEYQKFLKEIYQYQEPQFLIKFDQKEIKEYEKPNEMILQFELNSMKTSGFLLKVSKDFNDGQPFVMDGSLKIEG